MRLNNLEESSPFPTIVVLKLYPCNHRAEGHRELVQHGILPSLAGGECPGRCDLYCERWSATPSLTVLHDMAGAAQLRTSGKSSC
jgi:hypothetical protein